MSVVNNINGAADYKCQCPSWSDHLNKFGGSGQSIFCSEHSCYDLAEVGAQVQFDNDSTWYVIALCKRHTGKNETFKIKDDAKRAKANITDTCEKKK